MQRVYLQLKFSVVYFLFVFEYLSFSYCIVYLATVFTMYYISFLGVVNKYHRDGILIVRSVSFF